MLVGTGFAQADSIVNVSLEDASEGGNLAGMKMTATPDSVKAGRIIIRASNESHALVHEVIVVRPPANGVPLPYDEKTGEVVEKRIKALARSQIYRRVSRVHLRLDLHRVRIC